MFRKQTAGESSGQPFTNCVIFGNVSIVRSTLLKAFTKSRESTLVVAPHPEPTHTTPREPDCHSRNWRG